VIAGNPAYYQSAVADTMETVGGRPQGNAVHVVSGLTAVNLAVLSLGFVTAPLLTRSLGPAGRGELAAVTVPLGIAIILIVVGLDDYVARALARGEPEGRVLGSCLLLVFGASAVGMLASYPIARAIGNGRSVVELYLFIGFLLLPTYGVAQMLRGAAQGRQAWRTWIAVQVLTPVTWTACVIALYVADALSVSRAAIAFLVTAQFSLIPLIPLLREAFPLSFSLTEARRALAFGLRQSTADMVRLGNLRLDQVLMAALISSTQLGLYSVAVTAASVCFVFTTALSTVLYPRVAGGNRDFAARGVRATLLVMIAASTVVAVLLPTAIDVVFGRAFQGSIKMGWILLAASIFVAVTTALGSALTADGDPGGVALIEGCVLVCSIPVLIAVLPSGGGVAAAWVSLATYVITTGLLLRRLSRRFQTNPLDYLLPRAEDVRDLVDIAASAAKRLGWTSATASLRVRA